MLFRSFVIKQINNVYEKECNNRLKKLGITSSQCAVLDYLFHSKMCIRDRLKVLAMAKADREAGSQVLIANMKKNKKFQKGQRFYHD